MRVLSFANVTSCLALVVALSGGAYAATQLPKNSVGTKQLKDGAVTSAKVEDGSLSAADFGKLPAGPPGPAGPAGAKGEKGAIGDQGAPGTDWSSHESSFSAQVALPPLGQTVPTLMTTYGGVKFTMLCQNSANFTAVSLKFAPSVTPNVLVSGVSVRSDSFPASSNKSVDVVGDRAPSVGLVTGFKYTAFTGSVQADFQPHLLVSGASWIENGFCRAEGAIYESTH